MSRKGELQKDRPQPPIEPRWLSRPHLVVLIWFALAGLIAATGSFVGLRTVLPGPSSSQALNDNPGERAAIASGIPPRDQLLVLLGHPQLQIDSPQFIAARDSLYSLLRRQQTGPFSGDQRTFLNIQTAGHNLIDDQKFISDSRRQLLFVAETSAAVDRSGAVLEKLPSALAEWSGQSPGFTVSYLSKGIGDVEMFALINRDLDRSLIYTLPLSLLVLIWSFGSVVAASIPLLVALVCLGASLGLAAMISAVYAPVSATSSQLVVLLVLAIGVDYSLFIISRMREEIDRGSSIRNAIVIARRRAGSAVLFSGLTVALSLSGLVLMHDTILTSMASVSIIAVVFTVGTCVVVLPPLLLLLGARIETGRIRPARTAAPDSELKLNYFLRASIEHPVFVLLAGLTFLLFLSSFCFEMKLGSTVQPEFLPRSMQSSQAYSAISRAFPDAAGVDLSIILSGADLEQREGDGTVQGFLDRLADLPAMRGPIGSDRSDDGTTERYNFLVPLGINDPAARSLVRQIRRDLIPQAFSHTAIAATLGGTLPYAVDDEVRYGERAPIVYAVVLVLSMAFLLIAFRSIVVPIKAIILNLISTGASFGVLVLVFQSGWGPAGLQYGVIESFVPPLLFSILFGLSMDYHVFLLSRVREEMLSGDAAALAVARAISTTSRTITSAALIMVVVFSIIATLEFSVMKQLGIGLAFAVLIDATIVRSMLLPASLVLLGKWNWYFPVWMRSIPEIRID